MTDKRVPGSDKTHYTGIGYISVPRDVDLIPFIERCFRTGRVCMIDENSQFHKEVRCTIQALRDISFPANPDLLGSKVIWCKDPYTNNFIVNGVLIGNDDYPDLSEGETVIRESTEESNSILLVRREGFISLGSFSSEGSNIEISSTSPGQDSSLSLFTKGRLGLKSVGEVEISATNSLILFCKKKGENEKTVIRIDLNKMEVSSTEVSIQSDKIGHNKADQAMVRGNDLADLLIDLLTAISSITVTTASGIQPVMNKVTFETMKSKVKKILSKKSKLE